MCVHYRMGIHSSICTTFLRINELKDNDLQVLSFFPLYFMYRMAIFVNRIFVHYTYSDTISLHNQPPHVLYTFYDPGD